MENKNKMGKPSSNVFRKIPNVLLDQSNPNQITSDELLVYYVLCLYNSAIYEVKGSKHTFTSIDVLSQIIELRKTDKRSDRNKMAIKECLLSLREKGHIQFVCDFEGRAYSSTCFWVNIVDYESGKYTEIYESLFEIAKEYSMFADQPRCADYFAIMCVIRRYKNMEKRNGHNYYIFEREFASILRKSERQTSDIIDEMVDLKIIYISVPSFFDRKMQRRMPSQYGLNYDVDTLHEKVRKKDTEDITSHLSYDEKEYRQHNWNNDVRSLDKNDFVVLLTTKDRELYEIATNRIKRISINEKGKKAMESLRKKAQMEIDHSASELDPERIIAQHKNIEHLRKVRANPNNDESREEKKDLTNLW